VYLTSPREFMRAGNGFRTRRTLRYRTNRSGGFNKWLCCTQNEEEKREL
jgi:hypothetical protein